MEDRWECHTFMNFIVKAEEVLTVNMAGKKSPFALNPQKGQ